jgi:hypothetical protein
MVGQTYGMLTVVSVSTRVLVRPGNGVERYVHCVCQCGNAVEAIGHNLKRGNTKSCGCLRKALMRDKQTSHGLAYVPGTRRKAKEYKAWLGMIARCENSNASSYEYYGPRGVTVCAEWRHDFAAFYAHVGPAPTPQHSIDRFPDRDGDYRPGNVRWATPLMQARNRRNSRKPTVKVIRRTPK